MKRRSFNGLLSVAALGGTASVWAAASKPTLVASFSILGDVARTLAGDRVQVSTLIGNDQDAHTYQLRPSDVRTIRSAQYVVLNGLGFEGAALRRAVRDSKVNFLDAAHGITPLKADEEHGHDHHGHDHDHEHGHGEFDPHVWTNPANMLRYAENVAGALILLDPAGKQYYGERLVQYQHQLRELDKWAQAQFDTIPKTQRKVLTGHDAFSYMGQRYGIQFIAPLGTSTDAEASARTVAAIVQQVRREKIKAVFVENIKDPRLVQKLAQEAGVTVQQTPLYSDALGGSVTSYLQMMRHNVTQMVAAMR